VRPLVTVLLAVVATALMLAGQSVTHRYAGLLSAALLVIGFGFGALAVTRAWARPAPRPSQPSIDGSSAGPT
jgi:hypothetical protein